MASNGARETFEVSHVLAAMLTMRSGDADKKKVAVDYLGRFQKSVSLVPRPLRRSVRNIR
jgi:transportin-3